MRFLCLHGRGTNSDIFETQLAALFSRLSPEHTFDFLDAQFDCPPAPGISEFHSPPYLAWFSQYETQNVRYVHDFLMSVIEEDGPYDGLIGFSEGAALAASLLLTQEHTARMGGDTRGGTSRFKVAIFFNSVMPFSPSENIGTDLTEEVRKQEESLTYFLRGSDSSVLELDCDGEDLTSTYSSDSSLDAGDNRIFGFQAGSHSPRISIPTLHFIGKQDQFAEYGRDLVKLCQTEKAEIMIVDGGHQLARTKKSLDRSAELVELIITLASIGS